MSALVTLDSAQGIARLTLARPARHNSLVPELIEALLAALRQLAQQPPRALVLQAQGRSFSTGGDVRGFLDMPQGARRAYAQGLVGGLHHAILALVDLPCPVIGRVHGPVTGGSLGLVLACDLVAITPRTFLQPFYGVMGFGPDGGWTALLPERIGPRAALACQLINRRLDAQALLALGLADALVEEEALDETIAGWLAAISAAAAPALATAKRLTWTAERRARLAAGLEAEREAFLRLIAEDDTQARMQAFLAPA